ncbi:MAG TPA: excinuclease ABC subunit UvrA [Saprospiraceae bacterium]|nr:excinuclease ABC subunit UvrA [Saprospiraceae bacterium]
MSDIQGSNDYFKNSIYIKGARSNNLKNIDIVIPKKKLISVTGLSGSGKSSLIVDTLFAEGQRRYVESLSSYARQFLDRMKKPEVEYIKGICPAIAIEQRAASGNARSTVGSLTEVYDYLRLLYARIGHTYSPISGEKVKKDQVTDVVNYIMSFPAEARLYLYIYFQGRENRTIEQSMLLYLQKGFSRVLYQDKITYLEDLLKNLANDHTREKIFILIDRFTAEPSEENRKRIADSVGIAFSEGGGECLICDEEGMMKVFNHRFERDGLKFPEPSPHLFNYNNPYGACPRCEGYGRILGIDPEKVIPNDNFSVYEEAIVCWKGEKGQYYYNLLIDNAHYFEFPIHTPIKNLTDEQISLLWKGNSFFIGLNDYFRDLEEKTYKIQNRVILARYRGKTQCTECEGMRLRKESFHVKIGGRHIGELINMPIGKMKQWFETLSLPEFDFQVGKRIITEIYSRLEIMDKIGLSYLTLDRLASTLSGGETQRINLTRILGSNLTHSMYILDEPSIGLHPRDTQKLISVLKSLRDLGNTVIVVEHEEEVIKQSDHIIDMGPGAGIYGGEVVFNGPIQAFYLEPDNLTSAYLTQLKNIPVPEIRRKVINTITLTGAKQHNLKNIDITIPLNALTVISGVSGSGKTSLVRHILYPALKKHLSEALASSPGKHDELSGDISRIYSVEFINQNPIGKSSRSNPVTYVKAYDSIRNLFSSLQLSKVRGYCPKYFSFNVDGGRCDTCKGDGVITVEMQFLADVELLCEECQGNRFKDEILEVTYNDKNIANVLDLSIDEAMSFFSEQKDIVQKLQPLYDVGLGYIKLGQPSSTLSGGEAQRVKLASYLGIEKKQDPIFFIFDEPTTGLHFHDIVKLMEALNALIEKGHTVLIVEHNLDVIKSADWLIDLGPEGGDAGGYLLYEGPPEGILECSASYTGKFLSEKLSGVSFQAI